MNKTIDHFELDDAFTKGDADYNAVEAQAIACGMLSVNITSDKVTWTQLLFGEIDPNNDAQIKAIKLAGDLFEQSKMQLQDSNLGFELLLPDETEPLLARVKSLQEWCGGYLLGIGIAGIQDHDTLPIDSKELLADFTEIGIPGEFNLEDEDESEEALAEISEYVRMGVLLINEELQPIKQSTLIH